MLTDRVVAVTGGGRGIGREIALLAAREGARVVVNDLGGSQEGDGSDLGPAQEVVEEIKAFGGSAVANGADISDPRGANSIVEDAIRSFGRLDAVVNNAGISGERPFAELELAEFERFWRVHTLGHFNVAKAAWPHLVAQGGGRIVNTTSGAGIYGLAPFVERFAHRDVLRGRAVHLSDGSQGVAEGIAADGSLLLRTPQGLRPVISGDVSVRPIDMALPTARP